MTYLDVKVTVDLAGKRLEGGAAELVRTAIPADVDQRVESFCYGGGCGRHNAHVKEDEEVGDCNRT